MADVGKEQRDPTTQGNPDLQNEAGLASTGTGKTATSAGKTETSTGKTAHPGPSLRRHLLDEARRGVGAGASTASLAATQLGRAAEAIALGTLATGLRGQRALVGHVVGMHLCVPAGHLHGPREAPAFLYVFADALAIRPSDDAPMSSVPVVGLHMVLPELAIAHWLYKAGRIEHANLDLVEDSQRFASSLPHWTVDDFAAADPKVQVHRTGEVGTIHVYEHLGFANIWIPNNDDATRLKSALPVSSESFVKLCELMSLAHWPDGMRTTPPEEQPR